MEKKKKQFYFKYVKCDVKYPGAILDKQLDINL